MSKYFVLVERLSADAPWGVQFGDYEWETVSAERSEMIDKGSRRGNLKILTVDSARQSAIDAAVAKLNGGEG